MFNSLKYIYLRNEQSINEKRTPIVPSDIKKLINEGYLIYVQSSTHRIYTDEEYQNEGAIITNEPWYLRKFNNFLIIGLKELDYLNMLNNHIHLYFSHSYQNQTGSKEILTSFVNSNSILYDFEYLLDEKNNRLITFGYYAGVCGCVLGLMQYIKKINDKNIKNLNYWENEKQMYDEINTINNIFSDIVSSEPVLPTIGIIGPNGNTGSGVVEVLQRYNIPFDKIYRKKNNLLQYDILFNCIKLNNGSKEIWFDKKTLEENNILGKKIIIVDISCDYSKKNNPINIYNTPTTWENPVHNINIDDIFFDIIAIDNLPSLLPFESSNYFSNKLYELLTHNTLSSYWMKCHDFFIDLKKKIN